MQDIDMLASLVTQAESEGGDVVMIRAIIEEASSLGATHAMERLGLSDALAANDVRELRGLLQGWRDAKRAAGSAVIGWAARIVMMLLLLAIAGRTGVLGDEWL